MSALSLQIRVDMLRCGMMHGRAVDALDHNLWFGAHRELDDCVVIKSFLFPRWWVGLMVSQELRLKRFEFSRLQKVVGLQISGEAKQGIVKSRLYEACCQLWRGDSWNEICLREVVPLAMSGLVQERPPPQSWCMWLLNCFVRIFRPGVTFVRPCPMYSILLRPSVSCNEPPCEDGPSANEGNEAPPEDNDGDTRQERVSLDPDDHQVFCEDGSVRAATVLPGMAAPRIDPNNAASVERAIDGRINKKQKVCHIDREQEKAIRQLVQTAISGRKADGINVKPLFSREAILDWVTRTPLHEARSGKWSEERMTRAVESLCREMDPSFNVSAQVKAEPMGENKPPRMLLADGDDGQVLALMSVKCFEDLLFAVMEGRSMKHAAKEDAMKRVIGNLQQRASRRPSTIEGDGSAWDTTNTPRIRALCEMPILHHIAQVLAECVVVPESWLNAHNTVNNSAGLSLRMPGGRSMLGKLGTWILGIRRSGHRGTSVLNWWVNFCLWTSVLCKDAWKFVSPQQVQGQGWDGKSLSVKMAFEGDDSLLTVSPWSAEREEDVTRRWNQGGFNMELFCRTEGIAEFCGTKIVVGAAGPSYLFMPDLKRTLSNMHVSCSASAATAARAGDLQTLQQYAKSKAIAYAYMYRLSCPTLSRKLLEYAEEVEG